MKSTSASIGAIEGGAEWYEQIAKFEEYCIGKTADEVAAIETETNAEGHASAKAGTDLAAGCTMAIGDFQAAVAKACENAVEVEAETVNVGYVMNVGTDYSGNGQLNTTVTMLAEDADGKIVAAKVDVAQISAVLGADTRSKAEKKEDYGMKSTSASIGAIEGGAEWYEQAAAFETAIVGMTAADVAAIETETNAEGNASPKAGTDLAAGCTMAIGDFQAAIANAK